MNTALKKIQTEKVKELKSEFERRKGTNPRYSLRTYARDLKMSPALLSLILSGKKEITERQLFKLSAELPAAKKPRATKKHQGQYESPEFVEVSQNLDIQHGYEILMLDLLTLSNFKYEVDWISRSLGISHEKTIDCLDKLVQLGLIKETKSKYSKTKNKIHIKTNVSLEHIRSIHEDFIRRAQAQLQKTDQKSYEKRAISATSMAVNPKHLPEARRRIAAFQRELADLLTQGECTDLYLLNLQFFSVLS